MSGQVGISFLHCRADLDTLCRPNWNKVLATTSLHFTLGFLWRSIACKERCYGEGSADGGAGGKLPVLSCGNLLSFFVEGEGCTRWRMNFMHVFFATRDNTGQGMKIPSPTKSWTEEVCSNKLIYGVSCRDGAGCLSVNHNSCMTLCIHSWQTNSQPKLYVEPDARDDGWVSICTNCSHWLWLTDTWVSIASTGKEA